MFQVHPQASTSGRLHLSCTFKTFPPSNCDSRLYCFSVYQVVKCAYSPCVPSSRPRSCVLSEQKPVGEGGKNLPAKKFRNIPQRHPAPRQNTPCSRDNSSCFLFLVCQTSKQAEYTIMLLSTVYRHCVECGSDVVIGLDWSMRFGMELSG